MRVLFVVNRSPYPPWRGDQVRSFHLLRELADTHDITLVVVGSPPESRATIELEALGVEVRALSSGLLGRGLSYLKGVWDRRPIQVLPMTASRLRRSILRLAAEHDLVHGHLIRTAPLLAGAAPVVVDLVDALSLNLRRRAEHDRGPTAWAARVEAARLARYERRVIASSAATIVSSREDAEYLGGRPVVIPNGVDPARFGHDPAARPEPVVVFAGNLGYFPNVDAARVLAGDVMPAVRTALPTARLVLAGARPTRPVRSLAGTAVEVVADPPDLAAIVRAAAVAVVPIRAGSGIPNKVLEAMAVGTPVVTTSRLAAAIGATPGVHLLTAEDPASTAAAAVAVLGDQALATRLREAAHRFVTESFGWERSAAAVAAVWRQAARSEA